MAIIESMPFADPEVHRAYMAGYHVGFQLESSITVAQARQQASPPYSKTYLNEAWTKGFEKGLSNRQGEHQRRRKAQWYQDNRERRQECDRRNYRRKKSEQAMQALAAIPSPPPAE